MACCGGERRGRRPERVDGYVATVVSGIGVKAIESGQREPIKLRQRPALYAAA